MKTCPYCAEMIQESARKCRYCREIQPDDSEESSSPRNRTSGPPCPSCGGRNLKTGPWPWYLGTIGAVIVRAVICTQCGHHFDAKKPKADLATRKRNLAILINGIGALGILAIIGGLVALFMSVFK